MVASERALDVALAAARVASDKKAREIIALDVSDRLVLTDVFLIASAGNERQVGAIVDGVEEALLARGVKAVRREGVRKARWVLLDFQDVIVHVQHAEDRMYYSLERLWSDCPAIELPPDARGEGLDGADDDDAPGTGRHRAVGR